MRIGEFLTKLGVVTPEQLEEGLSAQVVQGGRIGTNLVELGLLEEEDLAAVLGTQHKCEYLCGEIEIDPEAMSLLAPDYCDKNWVLPHRLDGRWLNLLAASPGDLALLDAVAAKTGKRIKPIVVPEFRMSQLLRMHCNAFRPVRLLDIEMVRRRRKAEAAARDLQLDPVERLKNIQTLYAKGGGTGILQSEQLFGEENFEEMVQEAMFGGAPLVADEFLPRPMPTAPPPAAAAPAPPAPAPSPAPAPAPAAPLVAAAAPAPDEMFGELEEVAPLGADADLPTIELSEADAARLVKPLTFAEAQQALAQVTDRDEIATTVLRFAASRFRRAILFRIQGEMAMGWHAAGKLIEPNTAQRLFVSLAKPSPFKLVRDTRSHFLGPVRSEAATQSFFKTLGGEPTTAVLMPVLAAGRVVNILYGDRGPGKLASPDVGELLILMQKVARSWEMLIASRRK